MKPRYVPLVVATAAVAALLACGLRSRSTDTKLLLLDARLERTNSGKQEIVSQVRFVALSHVPTSALLPSGDSHGIAISFVLVPQGAKGLLVSSRAHTERFLAPDILGDDSHWGHQYAEAGLAFDCTTYFFEVGQDYVFLGGGKGANNVTVDYRVVLRCEEFVDPACIRHIESSLIEVNGERLHQLNVAVPQLMSAGARIPRPADNPRVQSDAAGRTGGSGDERE